MSTKKDDASIKEDLPSKSKLSTEEKQVVKDNKQVKVKVAKNKSFSFAASFAAIVAIILSLIALSASAYHYWQVEKQSIVMSDLLQSQLALSRHIENVEQQLKTTQTDLQRESSARSLAESEHNDLAESMQRLSERLGRTTISWRLAEIKYLLTIANHRLTLLQDRKTAIAIFETADNRLQLISDPSFLVIRQAISDELNMLKSINDVDISGMALTLSSLISGIEQLPLRDKKRLAVAFNNEDIKKQLTWQGVPGAIWQDLKSLVSVRKHQQPIEPLLPPKESWFLQENLRLKLEQARLSLLRRDAGLFNQYMDEAGSWITVFYDSESSIVKNTISTIETLLAQDIKVNIPDVGESLRLIRLRLNEKNHLSWNNLIPAINDEWLLVEASS